MDYDAQKKLWFHVILQALRDINKINPQDIDNPKKNDLLEWLDSCDFRFICDMAGVNHLWIKKRSFELFEMRRKGLKLFICRGEYAEKSTRFN